MQQRGDDPQCGKPSRQISNRVGTAVATAVAVNHIHLLHQCLMRQIGIPLGDAGIVQREESETTPRPIEPPKILNLAPAKVAFAVVNHHIGVT